MSKCSTLMNSREFSKLALDLSEREEKIRELELKTAAAVVIQLFWRTILARRKWTKMRSGFIALQNCYRKRLQGREGELWKQFRASERKFQTELKELTERRKFQEKVYESIRLTPSHQLGSLFLANKREEIATKAQVTRWIKPLFISLLWPKSYFVGIKKKCKQRFPSCWSSNLKGRGCCKDTSISCTSVAKQAYQGSTCQVPANIEQANNWRTSIETTAGNWRLAATTQGAANYSRWICRASSQESNEIRSILPILAAQPKKRAKELRRDCPDKDDDWSTRKSPWLAGLQPWWLA